MFKQFEILFKEMSLNKDDKNALGINIGELKADSVKAFTDLLYMPQIDKKLLVVIGEFLFRISNLGYANNAEKNLNNWKMIMTETEKIATISINDLNDYILDVLMKL